MLERTSLGAGWTVWSAAEDRAVAAYRPDVFDGSTFPAPCLPTVYVTRGRLNRRPEGNRNLPRDAPWVVTLRLEPDVEADSEAYDSKSAAVAGTEDVTEAFSTGEIDFRSLYQVPREEYLNKLDELTGSQR